MTTWKRQGSLPPGTRPQLQPGATWELKDQGVAVRTERYAVNTVDFIAMRPRIKQLHPTLPNLYCQAVKGVEGKLGLTMYDVTWEGPSFDPQEELAPPVYYLNGQRYTAPIDTHPKFNNLVVGAGGAGVGKAMFDENGKFQGFGKDSTAQELVGMQVFDDTALVWRVEFVSRSSQRDYFMSRIQKICSPMGVPPTLNEGRNWKLADFSEREVGDAFYDYSGTWEASGPGGWNKVLYGNFVYT